MDKRLATLSSWLSNDLELSITSLEPASADASFRRYFRVSIATTNQSKLPKTFIAMDSPPEHEDNALFVRCTKKLANCGLHVPIIYEQNLSKGFLLISDLGVKVYQSALNSESADELYSDAMQALIKMQAATHSSKTSENSHITPTYSKEKLNSEIQLFNDWFIQHYHKTKLSKSELTSMQQISELLIDSALQQPQVLVHRDYHCRNLLITEQNNPGIIDYQDMVIGPITYDLVSLFKDCYIEWPKQRVNTWVQEFQKRSRQSGIHAYDNQEQWLQWFDWMGIQRHLKVLGIFSRLYYRDDKDQYLQDIPLTYKYLLETSKNYEELAPLTEILLKYPIKH